MKTNNEPEDKMSSKVTHIYKDQFYKCYASRMSRGLFLMNQINIPVVQFQATLFNKDVKRQHGGCGTVIWADVVGCEPAGPFKGEEILKMNWNGYCKFIQQNFMGRTNAI